jgi:hypothetical protein
MPKLIIGVSKDLTRKAPLFSARSLDGGDAFNFSGRSNSLQPIFLISPGILAKSDYFDIDLSYSLEKSMKLTGHLGSLKLRVKF